LAESTQVEQTLENKVDQFKDKSQYMDRTVDKGIVNPKTGSSIGIRENGDITMASNTYAQYKLSHDSQMAIEISQQSHTITNRKSLEADEILVNKHKLNPQLYELTDFKQISGIEGSAVGNLTMMGTVLVKAWEPNLKKYVLIRRQVRIPIFSQLLNVPDTPESIGIDTDIANELKKQEEANP
jgi:hypothetical protein